MGEPPYPGTVELSRIGWGSTGIAAARNPRGAECDRELEQRQRLHTAPAVGAGVFYGRGSEIATNQLEDQETAMLCLHLLQICLVYVNTLLLQQVLAEPQCRGPTG